MSATIFATTSPAFGFAEDFTPTFFVCFFAAVLEVTVSVSWRENATHGVAMIDRVSWQNTTYSPGLYVANQLIRSRALSKSFAASIHTMPPSGNFFRISKALNIGQILNWGNPEKGAVARNVRPSAGTRQEK